jgi:hypothetical protein
MRTKLNRKGRVSLPIAAALALAIIFTFNACSGDANMSCLLCETGSISDLPKQLYLNGEKFNGNGDIVLGYYYSERYIESVPAGKIQNGQIALNLPENINTKYLIDISIFNDDNDPELSCSGNYSYTNNIYVANAQILALIPGKGECYLSLENASDYDYDAGLSYFSGPGKLTGTKRCEYKYMSGTEKKTFDLNFSKGWNIVYHNHNYNNNYEECYRSTDPKIIKGSLEWRGYCRGG